MKKELFFFHAWKCMELLNNLLFQSLFSPLISILLPTPPWLSFLVYTVRWHHLSSVNGMTSTSKGVNEIISPTTFSTLPCPFLPTGTILTKPLPAHSTSMASLQPQGRSQFLHLTLAPDPHCSHHPLNGQNDYVFTLTSPIIVFCFLPEKASPPSHTINTSSD